MPTVLPRCSRAPSRSRWPWHCRRRRLPRILLATLVMGGVIAYAVHALTAPASSLGRLAILAALVTLGVAVYLATLQLLGVTKLKDLIAAVRGGTPCASRLRRGMAPPVSERG